MREAVQLGSLEVVVADAVEVAVGVGSARVPGIYKRAIEDAQNVTGVIFIVASVVVSERGY